MSYLTDNYKESLAELYRNFNRRDFIIEIISEERMKAPSERKPYIFLIFQCLQNACMCFSNIKL